MLPVIRAGELPVCPPEHQWLIEGLWADQAVGIVGGEPKCGKSFLALDMDVAVAAGAPCVVAGVTLASEVVSTWRSTIRAALRSGTAVDDGSDPDASDASRNNPEVWNACLMSPPVRP